MLKKAAAFLKNIKKGEGVIIIFNNDADGICSCAQVSIVLEAKGIKPYIINQPMPTEKNLLRKIQTTVPAKIIFLDMAMDQEPALVKRLKGIADILIVDHHKMEQDLNASGIVHCNPRRENPTIYQSTSYLAYKICSELMDMKPYLWIAAVGMIADYNLDDSKDVVSQIREQYRSLVTDRDLYKTKLGRIADMIGACRSTRAMTCEEMAHVIMRIGDPSAFESKETEKMVESYKIIENEMLALMLDAEANAERHGSLMLYNIKSKYSLASAIATKLSSKYRDKVVIIYEKKRKNVRMSARNQSKRFDVAKLLQRAAEGMKASAGGHEAAAGATLQEKDWEQFKERLVAVLGAS